MNINVLIFIVIVLILGAVGYLVRQKQNVDPLSEYIKNEYNVNKNTTVIEETGKIDSIILNKIHTIKDTIRHDSEVYKMVVAHLMVHQNTDLYIRHFVTHGEKHDENALYDSVKRVVKDKLTKEHEIFKLFRTAFETEFNQLFTPLFEDTTRLFLPTNVALSFDFLSKLTGVFSSLIQQEFNVTDEAVVSLIHMTLITHTKPIYHTRNMNIFIADPENKAEEWVRDQGARMNPHALSVFIKLVNEHIKYVVDRDAFISFTNGKIPIRPMLQRDTVEEPEPTSLEI